jgi:hypothetical protein
MIQLDWKQGETQAVNFYINLYDKMTSTDYNVLASFKSQLTGKTKTCRPTTVYTNKDRYVQCLVYVTNGSENLGSGVMWLGNTDFPFGFYDVTIYQNVNNSNLDPASAVKTIYTGLANLNSITATIPVGYTEYTTNDSDTESVYITI